MPHVQEVVRPLRLLPFIIPICFALASSLSWRGNARSIPPEWMSIYLPSVSDAMAERSMCHPGLPLPQGLGQLGSPGWDAFQSAKSARDRFSATFFVKAPSPSAESGWLLRFHGSSLVYVFPRSFKRLDIKIYRAIREVCSISELFLNNPTHKLDNLRAILCLPESTHPDQAR